MRGMLAKKVGMTHIYSDVGKRIPVTVLEAGPCSVLQVKTTEKDGYNAVQVGFDTTTEKRVNKPQKGLFAKAQVKPKKLVREFKVDGDASYEVGQEISADIIEKGMTVDVTAISKGKGFAGVMKRHGFKGGRGSHGAKWHRKGGAIGMCADPAKVFKGMRMPGRMGGKQIKVKNLEVVEVDVEKNMIVVKGGVPSFNGAYVTIDISKSVSTD